MTYLAATAAAALLALLVALQLGLALGLPAGAAAWGGAHRVLPARLRLGSLFAAGLLFAAGWIVLARAALLPPGPQAEGVRVAAWVFAGYFGLNTLANAASPSRLERRVMTPVALLLAACFGVVALGPA